MEYWKVSALVSEMHRVAFLSNAMDQRTVRPSKLRESDVSGIYVISLW